MAGTKRRLPGRLPVLAALAFLVMAGVGACSSGTEPLASFPGRSSRPRGGATVAPPPATPPPERWERWSDVASWRVAVARAPSQHLAGDHEAETLVNDAAAAYPRLGPARLLGPGAVLVQRLYAPGATEPEVLFAMVRRPDAPAAEASGATAATGAAAGAGPAAGTSTPGTPTSAGARWEYLLLAPDGTVGERGALEPCVRCHAEAPHDGVFGRAQ